MGGEKNAEALDVKAGAVLFYVDVKSMPKEDRAFEKVERVTAYAASF